MLKVINKQSPEKWSVKMNEKESAQYSGWVMASRVILILDVLGCVVLAIMTLETHTTCAQLFNEFGVALPTVTAFLVSVPSTAYLSLFAGLIGALLIKEKCIRSRSTTFAVNAFVAVGGFAYMSAYVGSMVLPLFQIIEALQKGA